MKNLLKSILVFAISFFAFKYLLWFGIFYAIIVSIIKKREENEPKFADFIWKIAASIDQTLNACLLFPLNDFMRLPNGVNYGNIDETISGVTGKNQLKNKLTWFGKSVNWFLSQLEKNHSINSIELDEN
jgi:hypothetical protein